MIADHFDLVVRYLDQTLRAADWASNNRAELRHILARETLSTVAGVDAAYRDDYHRSLHPDLSEDRVAMLESQANFLWSHGFLNERVDVARWIDPRPLQAALRRRADRVASQALDA
jgi:ABC-type nitrate/sulfonate/bicarbonate transport system substrate-binding protein